MSKYSPEETYDVSENEKYNQGKISFGKWIENIWYHYKWVIILGGAIVIFAVIALVQLLKNDEPDINIMHMGPAYITEDDREELEETIAAMAYDCNGDEEINVNLLDITVHKFSNEAGDKVVNFDENNKGHTRFQTEIRAGDSVIFLLDEPYFNECVELGLLVPLDEIIDDADMPEDVISGCGVKISDLDAYDLPGLSSVPKTAILCLRRSPGEDEIAYGRTMEKWECNKTAFVNIIKYSS